MGNNVSLGYDEDEQEQQEQQEQQEHVDEQEHADEEEPFNKNDKIKKSSIKNKECANAPASESMPDSSKIKKRKQTVRNLKASKKTGKTKSNKRILREYQSRYNEKCNVERERERGRETSSTSSTSSMLLNSD